MLIKINNKEVEIKEGSSIGEAIEMVNAPYENGSIICLIKGEKEFQSNITKYKIKTSKGSIIIEMSDDDVAKPLVDTWKENLDKFNNTAIRWSSSNEVAIGPFVTDLEPSHKEFDYEYGDVILSLSGFSCESSHIIFSKENHSNVYGVPDYNKGIFAKIIGGRKTLFDLNHDDMIYLVEPIVERSTTKESSNISNLNTILEEGNQLFTYVEFKPNFKSPESVEHLFSLVENGKIKVDYDSNSFAGFYALRGLDKPSEDIVPRERGVITLRNNGTGLGNVYIYREDRVISNSHTYIGNVVVGMELIDVCEYGDWITVRSNPPRIMTLATSQKESEDYLKSIGIEQIRKGVCDDEGIIVSQEPKTTIEIINAGKVETTAYNPEDITLIEITDNAPRTEWYFRKITGLIEKPIGEMKVHFAFPGMKIAIFEGDSNESKGLIPENIPQSNVKGGEIGVTNMSRKNVGLIGVRFEDNDEFGPTAEPFESTNIVGKIITNFDLIEKLKEGDILYVRESMYES